MQILYSRLVAWTFIGVVGSALAAATAAQEKQELADWGKEAAQQEFSGMRRYAWVFSEGIANGLEQAPAEKYPHIHAFLADFKAARKKVDPEADPSEWKTTDVDALCARNPNYWLAVYEVAPADPLMMWLQTTLYAVDGQVPRTRYSQLLAMHSPVETPWKREMSRLIVSSQRLTVLGNRAVSSGIKLHDQGKIDEAVKVYRDVLSVIPTHAFALYELGNSLRTQTKGAEVELFQQARRFDPFRLEAYQGSFKADEFKRVMTLRSKAKPAWETFMRTPPDKDSLEQLELLSKQLQAAGLHDLALNARQLVVANRDGSYAQDDVKFIGESLKALMPKADFTKTLKRLETPREEFRIKTIGGKQ